MNDENKKPLFDFHRSIGQPCPKCGYPILCSIRPQNFPMKVIDCPEHMPGHWKFHEKEALKIAKAVDKAEEIMKEVQS